MQIRSLFAEADVESFVEKPADVLQRCCCLEQHMKSGVLFPHGNEARQVPSKQYLLEGSGISVHFSSMHENYFSPWKYVMKEDQEYIQSGRHPDLTSATAPRSTMTSFTKGKGLKKR